MHELIASQTIEPRLIDSGRTAEELSALVHQIYEAATQAHLWPSVTQSIAQSLQGNSGLMFTPYTNPQDGGFVFPWQITEAQLQLWASKYIDHDVWAAGAMQQNIWAEGVVLVDEDMAPRATLRQSVFYREFLSTMNVGRVCVGMIFAGAPGLPFTAVSVYRAWDDPAFSPADVAWMRLLVTHLSRSLGLMHRLDAMHLQISSLLASLDRLEFGVALLNAHDKVLHLNSAAQRVLKRRDGLYQNAQDRLDAQGVRAPFHSLSSWLKGLRDGMQHTEHAMAHFSEDFVIQRDDGLRTYSVQQSSLPASSGWAARSEAVRTVLFITDPQATQLPDAARLTSLYGLTPAQALVTYELMRGASYKQAAKNLDISDHTVASHVKEIYQKTKVNRQSDLVRNLMSLGKVAV
jgi:DNA-binding CsgD family transcriptional regulator